MSIFLVGLPLDGRTFISSISVYSELITDILREEILGIIKDLFICGNSGAYFDKKTGSS